AWPWPGSGAPARTRGRCPPWPAPYPSPHPSARHAACRLRLAPLTSYASRRREHDSSPKNAPGGRTPVVTPVLRMRACAVIPAYDAARTVGDVVRDALRVWPERDAVFVVDDGSRDDTARVAREAGARVLV